MLIMYYQEKYIRMSRIVLENLDVDHFLPRKVYKKVELFWRI